MPDLAVDPDHRLVAAAHVGRIDGQIRHFPRGVGPLHRESLLDGVLVGARERRVHQVARVGVARVHRELGAVLDAAAHLVDVVDLEPGMDALGIQVQRQGDQAHVAGAFPVAEKAPLHPVSPGHQPQLRGGHGGAPVVVGMQRQHDGFPARKAAVHPLDLVGVDVGSGHLHRGRQVQDQLALGRGLHHGGDGVAHLQGEVELGGGEGLGAVLEAPFGFGPLRSEAFDQRHAAHRHVHHPPLVLLEHHPAEHRGSGIVQVDDGALRPLQRLEGAPDQVLPRLGEHLNPHVFRHPVLLDQPPHEIEIGLGGGGEGDLDFLETQPHQQLEQAQLALHAHGLDQRLVAVAQIGGQPDGRRADDPAGPGPVGKIDRLERSVFFRRFLHHGNAPGFPSSKKLPRPGGAGRYNANGEMEVVSARAGAAAAPQAGGLRKEEKREGRSKDRKPGCRSES
ncbi:MAG: hypothetical protein KatS3mg123_3209 [Burkholderiales bacterium]|nr:MAG: hypothetical protein KatS3mg123_3209 [Burkholderiales bacterium]